MILLCLDTSGPVAGVAIMENGTWAPSAAKTMLKLLEEAKNLTFAENAVSIRSVLSTESEAALNALAKELAE